MIKLFLTYLLGIAVGSAMVMYNPGFLIGLLVGVLAGIIILGIHYA